MSFLLRLLVNVNFEIIVLFLLVYVQDLLDSWNITHRVENITTDTAANMQVWLLF